jgi:tetraprenyl-beta-curcumene synthase
VSRGLQLRLSARHSSTAFRTPAFPRQLQALATASSRELLWGLKAVADEVTRWRAFAAAIPDPALRADALLAIDRKRANIDGAALFWTLPRRRSLNLLRLLVAYEVMADYLDCTSERGAHVGMANGLCLHRALRDALDQSRPIRDYYAYHPWQCDGGYLHALVVTCQRTSALLPSFGVVRELLDRAASLTEVLALNHEPNPALRDRVLSAWASRQFGDTPELTWFEWCGGASAWLTVFALLAIAAEDDCRAADVKAVYDAYLPWISLAGTMLDSYVDLSEDSTDGAHSYIAHYPSSQTAIDRIVSILQRSLSALTKLPNSNRHWVIVSCMVAMYLSKDSARAPTARAESKEIVGASGALGHVLVRVLRTWRILYKQQSA